MTTRRRLSPDERREQILASAADLLDHSQAVAVAAIAKAAGVTPTLVYPTSATPRAWPRPWPTASAYFSHFEAAHGDLQLVCTSVSPLHEGYQTNHAVHIERVLRLLKLTGTPCSGCPWRAGSVCHPHGDRAPSRGRSGAGRPALPPDPARRRRPRPRTAPLTTRHQLCQPAADRRPP